MDHNYIDRADLIDRYIIGRLPEEESFSFEEHFVDCPQCLIQLKITERFLDELRLAAFQDVSRIDNSNNPDKSGGTEILRVVRRLFTGKLLGVAAIAAALVLFSGVGATYYVFRLRSEMRQTNALSAQLQSKYDEQQKNAEASEKRHEETEQELTARLTDVESKLQSNQNNGGAADGSTGSEINVPIIPLNADRGPAGPAVITINPTINSFMVTVLIEGEKYKRYRVTIQNEHQKQILKRDISGPFSNDILGIRFGSNFFQSGSYTLAFDGSNNGADFKLIENYSFQIVKNR